ncbi:hypothetical protein AS86_1412 [Bacillus thuringiensis HD1002]|uniref:Uncharacterized protein n=1 Tax=Bacillus thuringiensis subsp. israelensis TaxID=1430 RepID=A0AAX3HP45_BACTI|nr:hypothetical protein AS86_1412 [Bacillus thuringiensis HD1002]RCX37017.1 hypothetical protein DEU45_1159 [Bacillus sp. AG102]TWE63837.1 hypothetical protein FHW38_11435 [Bacillus thuringiensis]TWG43361.1 hypothetical protein FHX98_2255 [Bacillus sp. AK8]VIJ04324.1 hypothetical protein BTAR23_AR23_02589 [Bacillus thuringiensis serovar israelensis]
MVLLKDKQVIIFSEELLSSRNICLFVSEKNAQISLAFV